MSAISDKQHNQTELSMLRCSLQLAIVNNLRNCEQFEIKSQFLKLFTIASSIWIKSASVTVTISTWACCFAMKSLNFSDIKVITPKFASDIYNCT